MRSTRARPKRSRNSLKNRSRRDSPRSRKSRIGKSLSILYARSKLETRRPSLHLWDIKISSTSYLPKSGLMSNRQKKRRSYHRWRSDWRTNGACLRVLSPKNLMFLLRTSKDTSRSWWRAVKTNRSSKSSTTRRCTSRIHHSWSSFSTIYRRATSSTSRIPTSLSKSTRSWRCVRRRRGMNWRQYTRLIRSKRDSSRSSWLTSRTRSECWGGRRTRTACLTKKTIKTSNPPSRRNTTVSNNSWDPQKTPIIPTSPISNPKTLNPLLFYRYFIFNLGNLDLHVAIVVEIAGVLRLKPKTDQRNRSLFLT